MRTYIVFCMAIAALACCMCTSCSMELETLSAAFYVNWPYPNDIRPIAAVKSVKISICSWDSIVQSKTVNSPCKPQSKVSFRGLMAMDYNFVATAYDKEDGFGNILGIVAGEMRVNWDKFPPMTLTTIIDPGATLEISPICPHTYINCSTTLRASVLNPDLTYAFMPTGSVHWASQNTGVAVIGESSGVVTGITRGSTQIIACADTTPPISGETMLDVRREHCDDW